MTASEIIDNIGGTGKVAELCGVDPSTVSCWRNRGIPRGHRLYLRKIRPAAFGGDVKANGGRKR